MQLKLVTFTLFFFSSSECFSPAAYVSRGRRQRSGHRPGHQDKERATELKFNDPASLKVNRSECHLASVHRRGQQPC
jgi:hypothetical protein